MPTYPYRDEHHEWDVIKPVANIDNPEHCPECGALGERYLVPVAIDKTSAGDWNQQQWHPGLGQYVKGTKHARQVAKSRGLIEVGNESPEKIAKHFDKQREETRAQRWAEADRVKAFE